MTAENNIMGVFDPDTALGLGIHGVDVAEIERRILRSDWLATHDVKVRDKTLARLTAIRDRLAMGDPLQTTVAEYITDALIAAASGQE